ncbi:MAG TPA: prepilin-type N-terminal cleavage/methylation domain-containing protein [Candidatus Saccharimonadales bacterium]
MLTNTKLSRKQKGFTIIEVMIVLAIAALILLIVLLAVPALQRNSKNTTIKNDVATVAGGISTYESDNNGTVPKYLNGTGSISIGSAAGAADLEKVTIGGSTTVSTPVGAPASGTTQAAPTTLPASGTIVPYLGVQCDPNNPTGVANVAARSISLYYVIQTSSGAKLECSAA